MFSFKMETHEHHEGDLSQEEVARYARHLTLPEIGSIGQKRLKASSVLCVGSGGLGSPVLLYLAAAGVGRIGIVDFDLVEDSNLQRQVLHGISWIGKSKTNSARSRILEINPFCHVDIFDTCLNSNNALKIIKGFDLVCDCTDNFPSRFLINDACIILNKPNIYGAIARFEGQASVFNLDKNSPNYRDLIPSPPPEGLVPSCSESGVIGVLPGLIGIIQATEAIKIITGIGETLNGRLLIFDALKMQFKELTLKAQFDKSKIKKLINYEQFCSSENPKISNKNSSKIEHISALELKKKLNNDPNQTILLDVRTINENKVYSIPGAVLIPLHEIENGSAIKQIRSLVKGRTLYVHCKSGNRSLKALTILRRENIRGINLKGGIVEWEKQASLK